MCRCSADMSLGSCSEDVEKASGKRKSSGSSRRPELTSTIVSSRLCLKRTRPRSRKVPAASDSQRGAGRSSAAFRGRGAGLSPSCDRFCTNSFAGMPMMSIPAPLLCCPSALTDCAIAPSLAVDRFAPSADWALATSPRDHVNRAHDLQRRYERKSTFASNFGDVLADGAMAFGTEHSSCLSCVPRRVCTNGVGLRFSSFSFTRV